MTNIKSPESKSPEKLHKGRNFVAGLGLGLMALAGVEVNGYFEDKAAKNHTAAELIQFSQKGLAQTYLEIEQRADSPEVRKIIIGDFETNPFKIAEHLYAKDIGVVAQEIYGQLDGHIKPGDVVILPSDQFNPEPRRLV